MKAYTDLSQSKKLAEILPIESADMYYFTIIHDYPYSQGKIKTITKIMDGSFSSDYDTPCWSLAALFSVLPEYIKFDGHTWKIYNDHYGVYYMNADTFDTNTFSTNSENLVDACYEMIIKLHEQKIL